MQRGCVKRTHVITILITENVLNISPRKCHKLFLKMNISVYQPKVQVQMYLSRTAQHDTYFIHRKMTALYGSNVKVIQQLIAATLVAVFRRVPLNSVRLLNG